MKEWFSCEILTLQLFIWDLEQTVCTGLKNGDPEGKKRGN